jgi:hypothetical protein
MANLAYMNGRKKYYRPQAVLWANTPGTLVLSNEEDPNSEKFYVPVGYEIGANTGIETNTEMIDQFLILSDDNRSPINFTTNRIEKRERMINGRMRSYHIADKLNISFSWENLASRAFVLKPDFGSDGKSEFSNTSGLPSTIQQEYTTDGGAGGAEILDWYNNHQGSFWMFLAYDNYPNFGKEDDAYGHLAQYNEVIEVFFSSFDYSVTKRGKNIDLWNINLTLEEV